MRKRKSPKKNRIGPIPDGVSLAEAAALVRYVGSPEHKDSASFAGQPRPRADATICDRSFLDRIEELQTWLRNAILQGWVSAYWEKGFPRYVWFRHDEVVYIGRHVGNGHYKGWQLEKEEWPEGLP
jgi:hypothetical protein